MALVKDGEGYVDDETGVLYVAIHENMTVLVPGTIPPKGFELADEAVRRANAAAGPGWGHPRPLSIPIVNIEGTIVYAYEVSRPAKEKRY